jgi:hypothetical protein
MLNSKVITAESLKALSIEQLDDLGRYYDRVCWTATPFSYEKHGTEWEDNIDLIEAELEARGVVLD